MGVGGGGGWEGVGGEVMRSEAMGAEVMVVKRWG